MKRLFFYASMLLMAASFAACSSDDVAPKDGDEHLHGELTEESLNLTNYENICMNLLETKVEGTDTTYGILNAAEKDLVRGIYTVNVKNSEVADSYFKSMCVPNGWEEMYVRNVAGKKVVDFGKYGNIEYTKENGHNGVWGTIKVGLACLKSPLTISLVESDGNAASPYEIGDIVRYDGKVWLCTVEYGGGKQLGRLMRFGNYNTYTVSDYWKKAHLSSACADNVAVTGFFELMQDFDEYAELRKEVIKQFVSNTGYGTENKDAFTYLSAKKELDNHVFMISEHHFEYYCPKCARRPYSLRTYYFYIQAGKLDRGSTFDDHEYRGVLVWKDGVVIKNLLDMMNQNNYSFVEDPYNNHYQTEQVVFERQELPGAQLLWPNY